jgi:hypothetical protein
MKMLKIAVTGSNTNKPINKKTSTEKSDKRFAAGASIPVIIVVTLLVRAKSRSCEFFDWSTTIGKFNVFLKSSALRTAPRDPRNSKFLLVSITDRYVRVNIIKTATTPKTAT